MDGLDTSLQTSSLQQSPSDSQNVVNFSSMLNDVSSSGRGDNNFFHKIRQIFRDFGHNMSSGWSAFLDDPLNYELNPSVVNEKNPILDVITPVSNPHGTDPDSGNPPDDNAFNVDVQGWIDLVKYFLDKQYEFNQASAERSMQFESEEAQKLRDWQESLSNTQFQRAVEDMKKAGINPLLGLGVLGASDVPSGAMASGSTASGSYGSPTSILSSFVAMMASNKQLLESFLKMLGNIFNIGFSSLKIAK